MKQISNALKPVPGTEKVGNPKSVVTDNQREFARAYVRNGGNATAAARHAGYSQPGVVGAQLKKNAKVAAEIARERAEYERSTMMTKKKVMDGFLEAIEMGKIKSDAIAMVSGWREIARMCGYFEPTKHKIEVSVNGQVVIQKLQALDDAQLLALIDENSDPDAIEGDFTVLPPA